MKEMMWVFALIILSACETWSLETGAITNSSASVPKVYVVRNSTFNVGSEVNLTCSKKLWNETFYVIWKIDTNKKCRISHSNSGRNEDSCNGGMSLQNTSSSQSYLHIPNFSNDDVGVYNCETAYPGGADEHIINVAITVPPNISAWFEWKGNKMVAVCKAENGQPAANISWSHTGNSLLETSSGSDGLITVESTLELHEKNLSCIITHPYWKSGKTLILETTKGQPGLPFNLLYILIAVIIIAVLAGFLFFAQKKLTMPKSCRQANTSPSKLSQAEDVEEVEPYASYVQRVNSIYNS
ncbi:cell surface glycoprotein CD200 receptor 1 [Scomber scombrus]|uniref:Cell surface glycoprotein CD200 receptor 1 n=1 Tax=Scomber scombrus TaxID=13677 RepID=A0AAV1N641_SCOSC|nr:cell surface glycoprotein CD200 receptor 1 isoform X2 [Scomber scombrus]